MTELHMQAILEAGTDRFPAVRKSLVGETAFHKWGVALYHYDDVSRPSQLTPNDPDSIDVNGRARWLIAIQYSDDLSYIEIDTRHRAFNQRAAIEKMLEIWNMDACVHCSASGIESSEASARHGEDWGSCPYCKGIGFRKKTKTESP